MAEPLGDQRVVPGDNAGAAVGELADLVEGGVHVREAGHDGERPVLLQLLVVVHRVGGQHDRSGRGGHGDDGLAGGVPADLDQLDAGRYLAGPAGQGQLPGRAQLAQAVKLAGLGGVRELAGALAQAATS